MTRMPKLREILDDVDAVPDAAHAAEVEEITRTVPKMIGMLPDVLRDRADIRHKAALAEMIAGLTLRLDQLRPLAVSSVSVMRALAVGLTLARSQLGAHLRTAKVGEATKLHHIRATAYEKFLRTIEVA